jgi:hypothetical protein
MHSTASDGSLAPSAVVASAKSADLVAIALTDHDSVAGIAGRSRRAGGGRRVTAGCEFSAMAAPRASCTSRLFLPSATTRSRPSSTGAEPTGAAAPR